MKSYIILINILFLGCVSVFGQNIPFDTTEVNPIFYKNDKLNPELIKEITNSLNIYRNKNIKFDKKRKKTINVYYDTTYNMACRAICHYCVNRTTLNNKFYLGHGDEDSIFNIQTRNYTNIYTAGEIGTFKKKFYNSNHLTIKEIAKWIIEPFFGSPEHSNIILTEEYTNFSIFINKGYVFIILFKKEKSSFIYKSNYNRLDSLNKVYNFGNNRKIHINHMK